MTTTPKMDNTTSTVADLRDRADEALAAKARAEEAKAAAEVRLQEIRNKPRSSSRRTHEEVLAETVAHREFLEAEDALRLAYADAAVALDAVELAEGDALATEAAPSILRRELVPILAEEDQLRLQLEEVEKRREARIAATRAAWSALDTRRRATGLPGPVALPALPQTPMGAPLGPPPEVARSHAASLNLHVAARALVEALDRHLEGEAVQEEARNAQRIRQLTREENELRVEIELLHREDEKRQREREAAEKAREQQVDAQRERERCEREEWAAKVQAEQRQRDELIAAQKRREAGDAA